MKRRTLIDDLILAPWWMSVFMAGASYFLIRFIAPGLFSGIPILRMLATGAPLFAGSAVILFLALAVLSFNRRLKVRTQFRTQQSVESLLELSWKEFENITAELFRQRGYTVIETLGGGADGGVDLELLQAGSKTLVQCKRWKTKKVGLPVARELLGAMTAEQARSGILVTTSSFTADAQAFARKHSIELMGGEQLVRTIRNLRTKPLVSTPPSPSQPPALPGSSDLAVSPLPSPSAPVTPACPQCGIIMVKRVAKRGARAGNKFWGCPSYPKCRGTRPWS